MAPLAEIPNRDADVDDADRRVSRPWLKWLTDLRLTVNRLNETGTWTPTIGGTGGQSGQVYAQQDGFYVKVGRLVHVACRVQLSTLGTITNVVQIKGLPFAATSATGYRATGAVLWTTTTTAYHNMVGFVQSASAAIDLVATAAATVSLSTQTLAQADLSNTTRFIVSLVYDAGG